MYEGKFFFSTKIELRIGHIAWNVDDEMVCAIWYYEGTFCVHTKLLTTAKPSVA